MAVLEAKKTWKAKRPHRSKERASDITKEEAEHVRAAMAILRVRHGGSWTTLAAAMGLHTSVVVRAMSGKTSPSGGMAIRAARLAGASVDDLLSGAWPKPGMCPMCGRQRH